MKRNFLYRPEYFAINSGGVISVGGEYIEGGWKEGWVQQKVDNIHNATHRILEGSEKSGKFPETEEAIHIAEMVKANEEKRK